MLSSDLDVAPMTDQRAPAGRRKSDRELLDASLLLDSLDDLVAVFDIDDLTVLRANRGTRTTLGYDPDQLVGRSILEFVAAAERTALSHQLASTRAERVGGATRLAVTMLDPSGAPVQLLGGLRLLRLSSTGDPVFGVILRRPTSRDQAERRIAAERARADRLLASLHNGVLECDLTERRHLYANPSFTEITGYSHDDVINAEWPGPWWEPEVAAQLLRLPDAVAKGAPLDEQFCNGANLVIIHRDGSRVPVRLHVSLVEDGERVTVVALFHDRTDELRQAEELDEAHSTLAIARDRERIARNLHDNAIQRLFATGLNLQSALNRPNLDHRVSEAIDDIDETIRDIRATIFTLHTPRTMLEGLEWTVRSTLAESARVLRHQPEVEIDGDLDLVEADLGYEMLSVLRELVTNVAKHAKATATWVTIRVSDDELALVVADDGVGFHHQAGRAGLGVGNLVERAAAHGGTASIAKRDPWGTVVHWRVPLRRAGGR